MSDLNTCMFIGRLGKDPDVRYQAEGGAVTSFSIAVTSKWKSKSGEKQESTEWVNCTAFGKLGEICGEFLKKSSQVFISGKMKTEKYKAKDGTDRYSTKIIVNEMTMLGGKTDAQVDMKPQAEIPNPVMPSLHNFFINNPIADVGASTGTAVDKDKLQIAGRKFDSAFDDFEDDKFPF